MNRLGIAALVAASVCASRSADAFCGFYVAGGNQQMFNDATQVVLMRHGTRTVLAMQNNYKGPPEAFAMVIPVPVVLKEADVKTLTKDVFAAVEKMSAPRLVEYWEQDPCYVEPEYDTRVMKSAGGAMPPPMSAPRRADLGVTIEAKFTVGEYDIVILSAKDSTGLDTWLRQEKYTIPAGAEPLLRPYVEAGSKFFVAKVDPKKVKFEPRVEGAGSTPGPGEARAALSPLRFHYDSEQFNLPIRLGLANSSGKQDLIVNILAPNQRYEVANYKNVTIPTNIDVKDRVKDNFAAFYTALFDATVEKNPGAVVTEYSWQATNCDPCPGPVIGMNELTTLGLDVIEKVDADAGPQMPVSPPNTGAPMPPGPSGRPTMRRRPPTGPGWNGGGSDLAMQMVLTRLHARYGKDITNDLEFKAATPITGGREHVIDPQTHKLEEGAQASSVNNFQGRYAIRHAWEGPIKCDKPVRGRWGGPPNGGGSQIQPALDLAFAPRGTLKLAAEIKQDIPELGIKIAQAGTLTESVPPPKTPSGTTPSGAPAAESTKKTGCGCGTTGGGGSALLGLALAGLLVRRRSR